MNMFMVWMNDKMGGELERKFNAYTKFYGISCIITFTIIVLTVLWLFFSTIIPVVLWFIWFMLSSLYTIRTAYDVKTTTLEMFLLIPLTIPLLIVFYSLYWYLKERYPNSDNEDDIKKFNRIRKINSLL